MATYKVRVRLYVWYDKTFNIEADNPKLAKDIARTVAMNTEFTNEKGYEYEIDTPQPVDLTIHNR